MVSGGANTMMRYEKKGCSIMLTATTNPEFGDKIKFNSLSQLQTIEQIHTTDSGWRVETTKRLDDDGVTMSMWTLRNRVYKLQS